MTEFEYTDQLLGELMDSKICRACELGKPFAEYHKDSGSRDGHRPKCKVCVKAYDDTLQDERNRRARETYYADLQAKIDKTRAYHLAHPEWSKERLRAHHEANADRRYQDHLERGKDPVVAASRLEAARRSQGRRRAVQFATDADFVSAAQIQGLMAAQGGECYICDRTFSDLLPYEIEHIQPLSRGGAHKLGNLALSCGPCNVRKNSLWPFTEELRNRVRNAVLKAADAAFLTGMG